MVTRDSKHQARVDARLAKIKHALGDVSRSNARLARVVGEARAEGATWTDVGRALGMTQQGAQKRYGNGEEREQAHRLRTAERALKTARKRLQRTADSPGADPWPDGTVQGTIGGSDTAP